MAMTTINGIETHYEVIGSGPPLLMCSPGGFDADVEKWRTQGIYSQVKFLDNLSKKYTCIAYDRRDTGKSGGRVERLEWPDYAAHAKGMLESLDIERAFIMGGCMGCSVAMAFGVAYPDATAGMVLFWPVGGAKYRINGHQRFAEHLAFVHQNGLEAVVALARQPGSAFGKDARIGPWVSVLRTDPDFAERYVKQDVEQYKLILAGMVRSLLNRDTSPGAEPEDLLRLSIPTLIVPGADASHATSAARYLQECIPGSQYWDVPVSAQDEASTNARVIEFLEANA
ncbi:alpha/beta fold hydrolase [Rhizobium binxianense]